MDNLWNLEKTEMNAVKKKTVHFTTVPRKGQQVIRKTRGEKQYIFQTCLSQMKNNRTKLSFIFYLIKEKSEQMVCTWLQDNVTKITIVVYPTYKHNSAHEHNIRILP